MIPALAYLIIGTSPYPSSQTMTAVRYGSMRECLRAAEQVVLHDTSKRLVKVLVQPYCTETKPSFWIEWGP